MSYKKPERRETTWWRTHWETIGQMRAARWDVFSECETCRLRIRLDLEHTERLFGPDISLWNHKQSCPNMNCTQGVVSFWARPPELMQPIKLSAPWPPERKPGWWRK
jgi:hypothetical protein